MPTKTKSPTRRTTSRRKTARKGKADPLKETWSAALGALQSAQDEAERQIRSVLKKNKISAKDASGVVKELRKRLEKERAKAVKQLEGRVNTLQKTVTKEKKAMGRMVDRAVKNALATFNIPSRQEIAQLTRKVDQLSKKIDSFARRD
jgi:poly(hydroxyalkanoate) granule-associated protein